MAGFQIFTVEQTSSETVSVMWRLRSPYHQPAEAYYEVLQIEKVGDNIGSNGTIGYGEYKETGVHTDRLNEVEMPIPFEPGSTYTVKLTVFDVDHWRTTGHEINNTVESTFTKRKFHIFYFYISL